MVFEADNSLIEGFIDAGHALAAMIVTEEIAHVSSSLRVQVNMQTIGCAFTIYNYGSEALAEK